MSKEIIHDIENKKIYYKNYENICLKYKREIISVFENNIWIAEWKKIHYKITSLDNPVEKRLIKNKWLAKKLIFELQDYVNDYDIISSLNTAYFYNKKSITILDDYYTKLWFTQLIDDNGIIEQKNNFYIKWISNNLETIGFYLQYLNL